MVRYGILKAKEYIIYIYIDQEHIKTISLFVLTNLRITNFGWGAVYISYTLKFVKTDEGGGPETYFKTHTA